jgi:hypothetical protein
MKMVSRIRDGMVRAMDNPDPRVARKRENTVRFLDHVEERQRVR